MQKPTTRSLSLLPSLTNQSVPGKNISTSHGLLGSASMSTLTKSSINHPDTILMQCRHACKPQQPMRLALSSDFLHKNRSRALITSSQCSLPWLLWPDWFAIYIHCPLPIIIPNDVNHQFVTHWCRLSIHFCVSNQGEWDPIPSSLFKLNSSSQSIQTDRIHSDKLKFIHTTHTAADFSTNNQGKAAKSGFKLSWVNQENIVFLVH